MSLFSTSPYPRVFSGRVVRWACGVEIWLSELNIVGWTNDFLSWLTCVPKKKFVEKLEKRESVPLRLAFWRLCKVLKSIVKILHFEAAILCRSSAIWSKWETVLSVKVDRKKIRNAKDPFIFFPRRLFTLVWDSKNPKYSTFGGCRKNILMAWAFLILDNNSIDVLKVNVKCSTKQ